LWFFVYPKYHFVVPAAKGFGMSYSNFIHKVVLLSVIQVVFISVSAFAGTATLDQHLSQNSLLGSEISELSIDHSQLFAAASVSESQQYQLYAMASGSGKTQNSAAEIRKSRAALEVWHKYLGYGTIVLAGVTAATNSDEDLHESIAYATTAAALSTVLTGFLTHSDRFDTYEGLFSKDNLHIMLGTLGAVVLTTAVVIADDGRESSHSGLGVAGGVLMTLGVIDIKW